MAAHGKSRGYGYADDAQAAAAYVRHAPQAWLSRNRSEFLWSSGDGSIQQDIGWSSGNMARRNHFIQMNSLTTLIALGSSLLLCGCGSWPPIVESKRDIQRLSRSETSLRARGVHDSDIPSLARFRQLRVLDFGSGHAVMTAPVTDEGLAKLAAVDLPKLEILTLGYCTNITDAGLAHIGQMQTVTWLGVMACPRVTDDGLHYLLTMKSLTGLDLRGCTGITDRGLELLASKPNWQTILLGGCSNVTVAGVARLQNQLPKARVEKNEREWSWHQ